MLITTTCAYGQNSTDEPSVLITRFTSSDRMVWSEVENKYMFFDLNEREYDPCVWLSYFNDNGTGKIKMINVNNGETYQFSIYDYQMGENDNGIYLEIDAIQITDSQKVTIIVNEYENGFKMVSVFLPDDNLAIFFDTEQI